MPVDPQTGLDPDTGMIGLKETHQPTGAMGAVMSYLNADKSRQISQALQQHRQAQADMAQQQAQEYATRQQRDEQIRQAIQALGPNANPDQLRMAFLQNGGDYRDVAPQYRAEISAGARLGSTEIKSRAEKYKQGQALGVPMDELDRRFGAPNPDDMDMIHSLAGGSPAATPAAAPAPEQPKAGMPFLGPEQGPVAPTVGNSPAPLVGAKITALQGSANKSNASAASITAKTPAEIKALDALATMRRMKNQIKGVTGKPSDAQVASWQRNLTAVGKEIRLLSFDKYGDEYEMTPAREASIKAAQAEYDDIKKLIDAKTSGGAASTGTGTQSPSPFAAGTFDTTPAGGSLTSPGGTSSPKTVTKSIILPAQ